MDRLGEERLARAALARQEHRRPGFGQPADGREELLHLGALADHVAERVAELDLAPQALVLPAEPPLLQGLAHHQLQLVDLEGLDQVVVGAFLQGLDRGLGGGEGGDDHHRHRLAELLEAPQHLEPVHAGHLEVDEGEVGGRLGHGLERLGAGRRGDHLEAVPAERDRQELAEALVVVDDEDALDHGSRPRSREARW